MNKPNTQQSSQEKIDKKMTTQYRNASKKNLTEIEKDLKLSRNLITELETIHENCIEKQAELDEINTKANFVHATITDLEIDTKLEEVDNLITIFRNTERLQDTAQQHCTTITEIEQDVQTQATEINDTYNNILGYEDCDGNGISGLKDELESAFDELTDNIKNENVNIQRIKDSTKLDFETFQEQFKLLQEQFETFQKEKAKSVKALEDRVTNLLPGALSKGLAAAYAIKCEKEELTKEKHDKLFIKISLLLTCTSGFYVIVIVIIVMIFRVQTPNQPIDLLITEILTSLPILIPIMAPIGILGWKVSKQSNISRRLVEEYQYKEALHLTYEGLSKAMETIDNDIDSSLQAKLLKSLLDANKTNPGELLTGFNKADHPLLDIVEDQGQKIVNTIFDKINTMPIVSALTNKYKHIQPDPNNKPGLKQ